mmetsp:Transcript_58185/g.152992  ORF Transcript_58185/g.152992 Transcript_58185/m.152992 type:complete len:221 (+) Transcript_58185:1084-1746(+)
MGPRQQLMKAILLKRLLVVAASSCLRLYSPRKVPIAREMMKRKKRLYTRIGATLVLLRAQPMQSLVFVTLHPPHIPLLVVEGMEAGQENISGCRVGQSPPPRLARKLQEAVPHGLRLCHLGRFFPRTAVHRHRPNDPLSQAVRTRDRLDSDSAVGNHVAGPKKTEVMLWMHYRSATLFLRRTLAVEGAASVHVGQWEVEMKEGRATTSQERAAAVGRQRF